MKKTLTCLVSIALALSSRHNKSNYHDINIAPTSSGKIIDCIDIYGIVPNN